MKTTSALLEGGFEQAGRQPGKHVALEMGIRRGDRASWARFLHSIRAHQSKPWYINRRIGAHPRIALFSPAARASENKQP